MKSLHYVTISAATGAALALLATSPSLAPWLSRVTIARATASPSADAATTYHESSCSAKCSRPCVRTTWTSPIPTS